MGGTVGGPNTENLPKNTKGRVCNRKRGLESVKKRRRKFVGERGSRTRKGQSSNSIWERKSSLGEKIKKQVGRLGTGGVTCFSATDFVKQEHSKNGLSAIGP